MRVPYRTTFAALLWLVALVPPVLFLAHAHSPELAHRLVARAGDVLRWLLLGAGAAVAVGVIAYPPFVPSVRLAWQRIKRRLTTDPGPLLEAQSRLAHYENANDHLVAGRLLRDQGRLPEALRHLARAVELDPERLGARYELALGLMEAGNLPAAVEQLARVVERDEEHAFGEALLHLGIALERGGADARAVEVLEGHERRFAESRRNLYHRARALSRLDRREEAAELLRRAARAPEEDARLTAEDALVRARARVALLRGGRS